MTAEDRRLTELVQDAAETIEPTDRLAAVQARAAAEGGRRRRRVWLVTGGVALATAAAVAVVAMVTGVPGAHRADTPGPAGTPSVGTDPSADASQPSGSETPAGSVAMAVYYVGDTPMGSRLYREFQSAPEDAVGPAAEAARRAMSWQPLDPDYSSGWPEVGHPYEVTAEWAGHQAILVDVRVDGVDLSKRPAAMSAEQAQLAIQQVVYSVQAAIGERLPVQILLDGETSPTVLGVAMDQPVAQDPTTLALVNITTPEQGQQVTGSSMRVAGLANSFEATVPWEILDASGTSVAEGFVTAEGAYDRLYPWKDEIDVSGLAPGGYVFVARTDDPSGGEGAGPTEDTKDFTIE